MPTGYTSALYDGQQTFEDFLLSCARAFGALVTMRDEPFDAQIPDEFEPSDYHSKKLEDARSRLAEVREWSLEKAQTEAQASYESQMDAWRHNEDVRRKRRARYQQMLEQAKAWQPPTSEHVGLRDFMVQQLTESIDFDCSSMDQPQRKTGADFKADQIKRAERDIEYHTKQDADERERTAERTAWVRALRQSLSAVA